MNTDPRGHLYQDLQAGQLARQDAQNRASAQTVLGIVFGALRPKSVLDVGCGLGTWLAVAQELGATDVRGVEGAWLDRSLLRVEIGLVETRDLENGFSLGRTFDLVVCLEVAEHLSEAAAGPLVAALAGHGDVVLFSAAIPGQGGRHHVNEQFPDYWAAHFARHGLRPVDLVRPRVWDDPTILGWLRQNALVFAHERALAANEALRREAEIPRPLSVVHPDAYLARLGQADRALGEHAALVRLLSEEGTFVVARAPGGGFSIGRAGPASS